VSAYQLTPSQMKRQLPADHHRKVDAAMAQPGMGVALYSDGDEVMLCSCGVRGADIPGRFPASMWGTLSLHRCVGLCLPRGGAAALLQLAATGLAARL
jgi:hypothetical protein